MAFQVAVIPYHCITVVLNLILEEFAIYMNYVRKLGFEETPDYDFLRELFTKIMKTIGEPEDGVYDWMILNGGKGWEASAVCFCIFLDYPKRTKSVSRSRMFTLLPRLAANIGVSEMPLVTDELHANFRITLLRLF